MLGAPGPDFGTWDTSKLNSNAPIQSVADLARKPLAGMSSQPHLPRFAPQSRTRSGAYFFTTLSVMLEGYCAEWWIWLWATTACDSL
jgi:hypothetical protein